MAIRFIFWTTDRACLHMSSSARTPPKVGRCPRWHRRFFESPNSRISRTVSQQICIHYNSFGERFLLIFQWKTFCNLCQTKALGIRRFQMWMAQGTTLALTGVTQPPSKMMCSRTSVNIGCNQFVTWKCIQRLRIIFHSSDLSLHLQMNWWTKCDRQLNNFLRPKICSPIGTYPKINHYVFTSFKPFHASWKTRTLHCFSI